MFRTTAAGRARERRGLDHSAGAAGFCGSGGEFGFLSGSFGLAGLGFRVPGCGVAVSAVADHFAPYISSRWLGEIVAFLVIFLGVMILAGILGKIVRWMMKEAGLSFVDRFLGGVLGWCAAVCWSQLFWWG